MLRERGISVGGRTDKNGSQDPSIIEAAGNNGGYRTKISSKYWGSEILISFKRYPIAGRVLTTSDAALTKIPIKRAALAHDCILCGQKVFMRKMFSTRYSTTSVP